MQDPKGGGERLYVACREACGAISKGSRRLMSGKLDFAFRAETDKILRGMGFAQRSKAVRSKGSSAPRAVQIL